MSAIVPAWHIEQDRAYSHEVRWVKWTTLPATFITSIAIIVIGCSALCLTLPGINALTEVVLPALLPGSLGLALCIPLVILSIKHTKQSKKIRSAWVEQIHTHLQTSSISSEKLIADQILLSHWNKEFKKALLKELMERHPGEEKKPDSHQDPLYAALAKAYQGVVKGVSKK